MDGGTWKRVPPPTASASSSHRPIVCPSSASRPSLLWARPLARRQSRLRRRDARRRTHARTHAPTQGRRRRVPPMSASPRVAALMRSLDTRARGDAPGRREDLPVARPSRPPHDLGAERTGPSYPGTARTERESCFSTDCGSSGGFADEQRARAHAQTHDTLQLELLRRRLLRSQLPLSRFAITSIHNDRHRTAARGGGYDDDDDAARSCRSRRRCSQWL